MGSSKFSLDTADVAKLFKNAILVGASAALTYVAGNMADLDIGTLGPLLVPIISTVLDSAITWINDNTGV
tara:strand:+ start:1249 stop:1458 length:210 start_codon:yes stop_codon:yes gene_type:complete